MIEAMQRDSSGVAQQVVEAAYPMFADRGIHDVTMVEIEVAAGLSSQTVGEWFASRDDVGAAFLQRREVEWFCGVAEASIEQYGISPEDRLLTIFDVFDEWFQRDDYGACEFITVMREADEANPKGLARIGRLSRIRDIIKSFAIDAHLNDIDNFCLSLHILIKGAVVAAVDGDILAAGRSKTMARSLIDSHRPAEWPIITTLDDDLTWLEWHV